MPLLRSDRARIDILARGVAAAGFQPVTTVPYGGISSKGDGDCGPVETPA